MPKSQEQTQPMPAKDHAVDVQEETMAKYTSTGKVPDRNAPIPMSAYKPPSYVNQRTSPSGRD